MPFLSEKLPNKGPRKADKIPAIPIISPQKKLPDLSAIEFTKYTEKIKVVWIVGIGEVAQSNNINDKDFLFRFEIYKYRFQNYNKSYKNIEFMQKYNFAFHSYYFF